MKKSHSIALLAAGTALLLGGAVTAWVSNQSSALLPALPSDARSAYDVLFAQDFELSESYTHWYRAEQPAVTRGTILVLEVDPELVIPRETHESVLYVGDQTAERINKGHTSGRVVVLVPAGTGASIDSQPIWFGTPALPERVDAAIIAVERQKAVRDGVKALPVARWQAARLSAGALLSLPDRAELNIYLADLVERFSPDEIDLINGMRVERVR
jgi:hypothetical protein